MSSRLFDFIRSNSFARLEQVGVNLADEEAERRALGALFAASAVHPRAPYDATAANGFQNPWLFDDPNRAAIFDALLKASGAGEKPDLDAIRRAVPQLDSAAIESELISPPLRELVDATITETFARLDEMRLRRFGLLLGWWLADDSCNLALRDPLQTIQVVAEMLGECLEREGHRRQQKVRGSTDRKSSLTRGDSGGGSHE